MRSSFRRRHRPIVRARGRAEWKDVLDRHDASVARGEGTSYPELAAEGSLEFDAVLRQGETIAGRAVDSRGEPVAGARVDLVLVGPGSCSWPHAFQFCGPGCRWPPTCETDGTGRFEWLSFPHGLASAAEATNWVMTVEHPGYQPAILKAIESIAPDGLGVAHVEVVLLDGAELVGLVTGPDGRAACGAAVTVTVKPGLRPPASA